MRSFAVFPKSLFPSSRSFINPFLNMNRSRERGRFPNQRNFSSGSDSRTPHHSNQDKSSVPIARKKGSERAAEIVENTNSRNPQGTPVVSSSIDEQDRSARAVFRGMPMSSDSAVGESQDGSSNSVTRKNEPSLNGTPHQRGTFWVPVGRKFSRNSPKAPVDGGSPKQHQPSPKLCYKVVNASHTEQPLSAVSTSESVMSQTKSDLEDGSPPQSYDTLHCVSDFSVVHSSKIGQDRAGRHISPVSSKKGMSQRRSKSPNMKYPECSSTQAVFQALETDQNAVKGHNSAEPSKKDICQHRRSPTKRESSCHSPDFGDDEPYTPIDLFLRKPKSIILNPSILEQKREKKKNFERSINDSRPHMLRPGMVLLKGFITPEDQIKILKKCRDTGLGPGGFYKPGYSDGAKLRLHMMCLGKNWDPERSYEELRSIDGAKPPIIPDEFRKLVGDAIKTSHVMIQKNGVKYPEKAIPWMEPDICIVNFYTNTGKLGLHQDRDESAESIRKGLPVVSFSVGDSAEFLYGEDRDVDKAEKICLKSGDILIFGGKSRLVYHGVSSIIPDTAPKFLVDEVNLRPGRLNLTFRQY